MIFKNLKKFSFLRENQKNKGVKDKAQNPA